jgi:hypothetical protein
MDMPLTTDRLIVRDWSADNAEATLAIYGTTGKPRRTRTRARRRSID